MQAGWDESKVDVTERDFDCMTWQALRMPSIGKKAAVHAHAMNAALLGKEFCHPACAWGELSCVWSGM